MPGTADKTTTGFGQDGHQDAAAAKHSADIQRLIAEAEAKARDEEKTKLYKTLEREKSERAQAQTERDTLQKQIDELKAAERKRELEGMKPNEQVQARLSDLESQLKAERDAKLALETGTKAQFRAMELVAYRERVLRTYGDQIIPEMVGGNSEEEIDRSAVSAHKRYGEIVGGIREQAERELQARLAASQQSGNPAPPPNPAYPAPASHQNGAGGFPTPTNAQPVAEQSMPSVAELTSEEAVRSGVYSGELREQLHRQLRGLQNPGVPLGSHPRFMGTQMPMVQMPGGVLQPQGTPTGPTAPAGQPQLQPGQYPVPQQGQGQPQLSAQDQARAAIARTHAGQNPTMPENPGAQAALDQARAKAGGQSPQTVFDARFHPTPPVNPQQGGQ